MKSRFKKYTITEKRNTDLGRIIVLTGARQTGKTTIAKHCFPDYHYLSIEDPVTRGSYTQLTASQWHLLYPYAILDEVQKEPKLIESIKSVYDQFPKPRYVLLGSSQLLLMQKIKESLAGRCIVEEIYPLTIPELMTQDWEDEVPQSTFQQLLKSGNLPHWGPSFNLYPDYARRTECFDFYLKFGGYPALVNVSFSDDNRHEWLANYIRTYLERDIRDLAKFRHLEPFVKTQRMTAHLTGQQVNYATIAKEADISAKTAQKFLHYLEISYQTLLLQPWHKNPLKKLAKSPKLHYLDPGIQRTIIQKKGELTGHEFESAIIAELYKQAKAMKANVFFYHLRTLDGREIDLLIESEHGYYAFEIKTTTNVNATDCKHLRNLKDILDKPILLSIILSNDIRIKHFDDNIWAVPAAMFLT